MGATIPVCQPPWPCGSHVDAVPHHNRVGAALHDGVVALKPELAARVIGGLKDDGLLATLHEPHYNMLAYPWSGYYQQSNQWAIETLALAFPFLLLYLALRIVRNRAYASRVT